MKCNKCNQEIEYDEGEGNLADGYVCYECLEKCKIKECRLLFELFNNLVKTGKSTNRDYWVMTELYVKIHNGKDYC